MLAMLSRLRTGRSAAVVLVVLGAAWAMAAYQHRYGLAEFAVDREAVRGWLRGADLYAYRSPASGLGTAVSPVAALLLVPLAVLPGSVGGLLLGLTGVAAVALALLALAGPVARRYGRSRPRTVLLAVALALLIVPVRTALGLGHLDLVLFGLVTADIVAVRRRAWASSRAAWWPGRPAARSSRGRFPADQLRRGWATGAWAGVGTGVAIAMAVGPVLFLVHFALTRQWRAAVTALLTASTLLAGSVLIAPAATAEWFGTVLPHLDRSGPIDSPVNQSLAGVLTRLYESAGTPVLVWLSFSALLLAVGLIRARAAHAEGDEIAAFTLVGLAGAAVGPVSRTYELSWLVPALLILVDAAARQRTVRRPRPRPLAGVGHAAAAVLLYLLVAVDPVWTLGWNAYALALIVLVNGLPWRPGVAPARPARRTVRAARPVPAIPGPRGS